MIPTIDEIIAEVKAKTGDLDDTDGTTQLEREARTIEAESSTSPYVTADTALNRILGEELFYISEEDEWINPYEHGYMEALADHLHISVEDGNHSNIKTSYSHYKGGEEYLKYRSYVSRIFYHEIANAILGKESKFVIYLPDTKLPIHETLLIKTNVYEWARDTLKVVIDEWSLDKLETPNQNITPTQLNALGLTKNSRISIHITLAILAKMLVKHGKTSRFKSDDPDGVYNFNSTAIAEEASDIYCTEVIKGLDSDAPAVRGQGKKSIVKRLDLARKLLKESLTKM